MNEINKRNFRWKAVFILLILTILFSTSVFAAESGVQKRKEVLTYYKSAFPKYLMWNPVMKLEGKDKTIWIIESVKLTETMATYLLMTEQLGAVAQRCGFKKIIFIKQRYNEKEFNGWIYNVEVGKFEDSNVKAGGTQKDIEYLSEAIRLKPDDADAYDDRGVAYANLGQYQRAIDDFNEAIRLKPDFAKAYNNRGGAYLELGQQQRAIEDFNKAIRLKPDFAMAYQNLGNAYYDLGQYQRAIEDCNEAIRLKLDFSGVYATRGGAYIMLGNNKLGCRDAQKACALGECKGLEWAKSNGKCR